MSIFASDTTETIDIPFEPGHTVTIQKLSGWKLEKAQKAFFNELIADVQTRGGAKVQKDIETLFVKDQAAAAADVAKVQADPLNGYDKYTLIAHGVKALTSKPDWSTLTLADRLLLSHELNDDAVELFARAVLRLAKPSLFQTPDEQEAAQKNA